jgi:hypothetical protein
MKKVLGSMLFAALLLGPVMPAYADHGRGGNGGGDGECGRNGGCNNERDEDYSGAGCKYVCPSFDKSPVHDAFNFSPFICMPGATCYEDGDKRGGNTQQPAQ